MDETSPSQDISAQFEACLEQYTRAANDLLTQLEERIRRWDFHVHSLNGRIKSTDSLRGKLKLKQYQNIDQVSDLIGVRIIAYFRNEIDLLSKMVEDHFDVDWSNSRSNANAKGDCFGYQSVHYVLRMGSYDFGGKTTPIIAEIQIRTVLQHAWAEIEHDLRYKGKVLLTEEVERNFARVAAVLETADLEFVGLRKTISELATVLVHRGITPTAEEHLLTEESLNTLLLESHLVSRLDQALAEVSRGSIHYSSDVVAKLLGRLREVNIETTSRLESELYRLSADVVSHYKSLRYQWLRHLEAFPEKHGNNSIPRGTCITYLWFLLSGKSSLEDCS